MKAKTLIAVTRCLGSKHEDALFHFRGVYLGTSVKVIKVLNSSVYHFIPGDDYVLRLRPVEILDGKLICFAEKAKRLEEFPLL
jgi:hypothetical protein